MRRDVDWPAVKEAYINGATHREISQALGIERGTLSVRAREERWLEARLERDQKRASESVAKINDIWQARSAKHRETIHALTTRVIEAIEGKESDAELLKLVDKLDSIDKVARRNIGLDTATSGLTFSLSIGTLDDVSGTTLEGQIERVENARLLDASDE